MLAHFDRAIEYAREAVVRAIDSSFMRVGGLLLPVSAGAYTAFATGIRREVRRAVKGPAVACGEGCCPRF